MTTAQVPRVSPPRAIKRPRNAETATTPTAVDDSHSGSGVEYHSSTLDQSPEEDDDHWEDEAEPEEAITLPVPPTSKGEARAAPTKAPAPKDKKGKLPVEPYGARKEVFHWLHFHVRSMIQSFGELEQICIVRAQSERALIHAQRKLLREETEKIWRKIELEKVKTERYKLLGPQELAIEYHLLAKTKDLEVLHARNELKALEIKFMELQIDLAKPRTVAEEAIKDCLAIENQMLRTKEVTRVGSYIHVEFCELKLQPLFPLNVSIALLQYYSLPPSALTSYLVSDLEFNPIAQSGMETDATKLKRVREALFHAQRAVAILGEAIDSIGKDDLPTGNTVTNASPPAPADPSVAHDSPAAPKPAAPKSSVAPEPPTAPAGPPAAPADPSDPNLDPRTAIGDMIPQPKIDPRIGANIRKRTQQRMLEDPAGMMAEWEPTRSILAGLGPQSNPYVSEGVDRNNKLLHPREHPNHSGKAT
ncbi:hypothetical protein RSOLAG22IIIB_04650 [Rhizoctonia solani]|uniref:Uncharacterized protein n=1 Tax=Rhizoctonia solani TaxID=456999 RepID=A0A0K6FZ30_9AGAM|nr:hypothetical protein RSOLAG22IIIB_04650 [Rhizoctonia solani]